MAPSLKGLAKGSRAFANWDEDALTMAVDAARDCLAPDARAGISALYLASTTLPYADLQNAAIVAGALDLPPTLRTLEFGGPQRAAASGLIEALLARAPSALVIAAEKPKAKPASTQEMTYGAGAAALCLGSKGVIARLLAWGSEALKQQWLPRMASGEGIGALGITEPGAGSDAKAIRTRAVLDGDTYVVNGQKTYISNGQNCDLLVLAVKTDPDAGSRGVSLLAADMASAGVERGRTSRRSG